MSKLSLMIIVILLLALMVTGCSSHNEKIGVLESSNNKFNINNLNLKTVELVEIPSEGGFVRGYYDHDALVFIDSVLYGSMGKVEVSIFYYSDIRIIKNTEVYYSNSIESDKFSISHTITKEYIIYDDKLYLIDDDVWSEKEDTEIINMVNSIEESLVAK